MPLNCGVAEDSESPLDFKEIQPVHPKGDQSWIFIGRTDAEAEAPVLWPPDVKSWLLGKDPDAGKDWRQEEKGTTEDEMVGWHHRLDGHEFEQAPGAGDEQRSLACCSPRGHKESDMTEWQNSKYSDVRIAHPEPCRKQPYQWGQWPGAVPLSSGLTDSMHFQGHAGEHLRLGFLQMFPTFVI